MKQIIFFSLLSLFLFSCTTELPNSEVYDYSFQDRDTQGEINGAPFLYKKGYAEKGQVIITVYLYDIEYAGKAGNTLVPDSTELLNSKYQVKIEVPVDLDVHDDLSEWATRIIFTGTGLEGENHAQEGAVQLTNIDVNTKTIEGQIDATLSTHTDINGKFKVLYK